MPDESLLTPNDVAEILGVSVGTLAQWRHRGHGPRFYSLTGQAVRYRRSDVDEWVESRRREPEGTDDA